jgi:hypothetical protein
MPQFLAAYGLYILEALLVAYTFYDANRQAILARQRAKDAYNASLADRLVTIRSGVSPRSYVLGVARIGGTLIYADSVGDNKTQFDQIIALAANKCDLIAYYTNDEYTAAADWPPQKYTYGNGNNFDWDDWSTSGVATGATMWVGLWHAPHQLETSAAYNLGYSYNYTVFDAYWMTSSTNTLPRGYVSIHMAATILETIYTGDSRYPWSARLGYMPAPVTGSTWRLYITYKTAPSQIIYHQFISGDDDQQFQNWGNATTPMWDTSTHKLNGVCAMRTLMLWDENVFSGGAPAVNALLRGKATTGHPFFDPRDSTNPDYTNNPALLCLWWATLPRNRGGCGIPLSWISLSHIAAAANVCDEPLLVKVVNTPSNLVSNNSFEQKASNSRPLGFTAYNNGAISVTYTNPIAHTGTQAYGLKANASTGLTFGLMSGDWMVEGSITGGISGGWKPQCGYTVGFWAKKVNGAGWTNTYFGWNTAPASVTAISNPSLTTVWQWYEFNVIWGDDIEGGGNFFISVNGSTVANDEIHIDDISITQTHESINRYECNTVLSTDSPPLDNLDIILSSMAGKRVFTGGQYRFYAGAFRSATITMTDSDVVGDQPITVMTGGNEDAPPNSCTAKFADASKNWVESSPPPVVNQTYIDLDGHEVPLDINLPATTDPRHANYLMGVALEMHRPAFTITIAVGGIGENISLLDTVQLNLSNRSAYAGKTFEVVNIEDSWDGQFKLTLNESKTTTFALDADRFTPSDPAPIPDLSYLWMVIPLQNYVVTVVGDAIMPDSSAALNVSIVWDAVTQAYVLEGGKIENRYRPINGDWVGIPDVEGNSTSTSITFNPLGGMLYQFQGRVTNGVGAHSEWSNVFVEMPVYQISDVSNLRVTVTSDGLMLTWDAIDSVKLKQYEIRTGSAWDSATTVGTSLTNVFRMSPATAGSHTWLVKAIDQDGIVSVNAAYATFTVTSPSAPSVTSQVVDNNVLLSWTAATGTQPILTYEIRRGAAWASATVIGTKTGLFTSVFETVAGTFSYWVAAIDIGGNYGTPSSASASVSAPPDYILNYTGSSSFGGTCSNALARTATIGNTTSRILHLPVDTAISYQNHFTSNGWSTPNGQISAGFPVYLEKSVASGYYEEVTDMGTIIAASKITVIPTYDTDVGTPTKQYDISTSTDGTTYTTYTNVMSTFATNFRYVKVRLTATSSGGDDILTLTGLKLVVESKIRSDAGTVAVTSSGTTVAFNVAFSSVLAIECTPTFTSTTSVRIPVVKFAGGNNPTSFQIFLYDNVGNLVSGNVNWSVKGY